jgi:hypothetical protein
VKHFSPSFYNFIVTDPFCIFIFLLRFACFLGLFLRPKLPGYLVGWLCSLLRHGMDNLLVSLEGPEAHALEERATRDNLSRDEIAEVGSLLFFCSRQINLL